MKHEPKSKKSIAIILKNYMYMYSLKLKTKNLINTLGLHFTFAAIETVFREGIQHQNMNQLGIWHNESMT
jgi:hypothetical protein